MADRGFKGIDAYLNTKNIQLVRPPSVLKDVRLSKEQVLFTKRVASIRIHVERSVRRFREISMLLSHATVNHSLISHIDDVVQICGGLINLQSPLIRT